ncbi:Hypothetical protein SCF082_LOCUS4886 [Durusdinium trenchii]|uniref:AD domain-containing protein n=1 Tax=Durusdinium trenchii TaxID=1381693 RepID=A0ABP0I5E0_9DINO
MAPPRTGSEPHVPPWRRVAAVDGREAQIRVVTTFGEEIARGPQWGAGGAVLRTKVWEKTPVAGSWCGVHVVSEHRPFYQFSPAKSGGSLSVCRADSIKRGTSLATRPYLLLRCYPPTFLQLFITEEGELFCVDIGGSNSVVLCQRPWPSRRSPRVVTCGRRLENGHVNYKWTKTNIIREVVATGIPPTGVLEELPSVDLDELEAKALQLEEEASQNAARFGVGVTEQAQDCFDALSKTMQVEWEGEDIKCMGCKISKPYDPMKSISGPNPQTVDRVRKVLQSELGRMQKKSGK